MPSEAMPHNPPRSKPNILITGTPGCGKTTMAEILATNTGFKHFNISAMAKERVDTWTSEWDEEYNCHVLDEDMVIDDLEEDMSKGGCVVDYHGCDFFPERWFDLVVVLRCPTEQLYDRLKDRQYSQHKLQQNVECEIVGLLLEEAMESYRKEIIKTMNSKDTTDMDANVDAVEDWIEEDWVPGSNVRK